MRHCLDLRTTDIPPLLFQSALGFEYKGEVEKHSSQKGKSMGTCGCLTLGQLLLCSRYPALSALAQSPSVTYFTFPFPVTCRSLLSCHHPSVVRSACPHVFLCWEPRLSRGDTPTCTPTGCSCCLSSQSPEQLLQREPRHCST